MLHDVGVFCLNRFSSVLFFFFYYYLRILVFDKFSTLDDFDYHDNTTQEAKIIEVDNVIPNLICFALLFFLF